MAHLIARAVALFDDERAAMRWLKTTNAGSGGSAVKIQHALMPGL